MDFGWLNTNTLSITIIALIPILGWLYFFQTQKSEKRNYVLITFFAGMLSVLPIKLYEQYWDYGLGLFEHINIFQYLADLTNTPALPTLFAFILMNAVVAFLFFLLVGIMMFFLEVLSGDNTVKQFMQKWKVVIESPTLMIMIGAITGVVGYAFYHLESAIWFFVIVGILEEFVKHLCVRFSDEFKMDTVQDAISFSIIVALGFAFVENILYISNMMESGAQGQQLWTFIALRSTISVAAHVCFSAILGYYYGMSQFACEIYQTEEQERKHPGIKLFHQIMHLKETTCFKEETLLVGMLIAMVTHAIFNSLLQFNLLHIVIPLLAGMFFYTLSLYHKQTAYHRTGQFKTRKT